MEHVLGEVRIGVSKGASDIIILASPRFNEARAVLLGRRPSAASAPRPRASASAPEQIALEASARARAAETARLALISVNQAKVIVS